MLTLSRVMLSTHCMHTGLDLQENIHVPAMGLLAKGRNELETGGQGILQ